jgi:Mn-dependent DtxR family transcriptional regulator
MGLSVTQMFLVGAIRAVGPGDYFRWDAVGTSLGYSAAEASQAIKSLDERKLVVLLQEGGARLSHAGRQLAGKLEAKLNDRERRS